MKALLLAAVLALTPVPALAAPAPATTTQQLSQQLDEVALNNAQLCVAIYRQEIKLSDVVAKQKLTTEETLELALHCKILEIGINAGIKAASQDIPTS